MCRWSKESFSEKHCVARWDVSQVISLLYFKRPILSQQTEKNRHILKYIKSIVYIWALFNKNKMLVQLLVCCISKDRPYNSRKTDTHIIKYIKSIVYILALFNKHGMCYLNHSVFTVPFSGIIWWSDFLLLSRHAIHNQTNVNSILSREIYRLRKTQKVTLSVPCALCPTRWKLKVGHYCGFPQRTLLSPTYNVLACLLTGKVYFNTSLCILLIIINVIIHN